MTGTQAAVDHLLGEIYTELPHILQRTASNIELNFMS